MRKFILKRLAISVLILFLVSFIVYVIMRCIPSSYVERLAREIAQKPGAKSYTECLAQLNGVYGLDKGIIIGFFGWLSNAVRGNFGDSWQFNMPVMKKFSEVIWASVKLGAAVLVLEYLIALPLGILAAKKQYSAADYTVTTLVLLGISLPSFFLATILKLVFSVKLGWFDLYGAVGRNHQFLSGWGQLWDSVHHYLLPVITLTAISVGSLMRYTRTNMLEVLNADYIRTARAKGLSEFRVVTYHAFRNTLIPIVTLLGASLPGLFAGALVTETLFQIPGIGYTSYLAILAGDIPFSMFYLVFIAFLTLLGNLIADVLYAVVDPRVRIA